MQRPVTPWLRSAIVVIVAVAISVPIAVTASDRFTDVPDSNIFHGDIAWLADAGITKGCNPPANDAFCPKDPVTREQMAAFMRRLAESRAVDAGSLAGVLPAAFVHGAAPLEIASVFAFDGAEMQPGIGMNSISRLSEGEYLVAFAEALPAGEWPMFMMSSFSPDGSPVACSWLGGGFVNTLKVVCTDLAGTPKDTAFSGMLLRQRSG